MLAKVACLKQAVTLCTVALIDPQNHQRIYRKNGQAPAFIEIKILCLLLFFFLEEGEQRILYM